ncbi:MAG: 3-polyprenyl-4-hydroxybenzoate decarboxylase [Halioglobus sp.]|jgi:3-polyprenyl-4-hydroxybenzoate decarboxylase
MNYDSLAKDAASTLSGMFAGGQLWYERDGAYAFWITAVIRKDVELLDDNEQVVSRVTTVRIAHNDISIVPNRGDTLDDQGGTIYTLGKKLSDDGFFYLFEATT